MNIKIIAALAVLMACLTAAGCMVTAADDSDASSFDYVLTDDSVKVGTAYSKALTGPGLMSATYYTVTGASWLSITYQSSTGLTASGTPTAIGAYNVTVTGPVLQGASQGKWTWTVNVINNTTSTVTVYGQNGTAIDKVTMTPGGTYTLPTLSDTSTHKFEGYYTAVSGGTYVGTSGTVITVSSDRSIYSHWTAFVYYKVTLDLNGYYAHPNAQLYITHATYEKGSGETFSLTVLDTLINSGLVYDEGTDELVNPSFLGWSLSPTGSVVSYASFTVSGNVTYYAIWGPGQGEEEDEEDLTFLDGTNSVIGVSGNSYSYSPDTNIETAVITYTGTVPWLTFSGGILSGSFPAVSSPTTYIVILTAASGSPVQTVTQSITFYVYPSMVYINEPDTSMFMGESYDFDLETPLSGVTYSVSGVDWLVVSNGHIVGSAPYRDSTYNVTFTVISSHVSSGQSNIRTVTLTVNEILEFTTLPTSSFVASQVEGSEQYQSFILEYLGGMFSSASSAASGEIDYFFSGNTVKFVFTGTNAEDLKWYVNDVLESEDWTFTKTFSNGSYKISCIAENELGPSEVFSVNISVEQGFMGLTLIDYLLILVVLLAVLFVAVRIKKMSKRRV